MAARKEKTFRFVIVGGGIAGVTCVEQVNYELLSTENTYMNLAWQLGSSVVHVL